VLHVVIEDQPIRSIAISTGGGDAPGLNAVIRAAVLAAENRGWNVWGIRDGFHGLMEPEAYGGQGVFRLTRQSVAGISHLGGTILGTTNRGNPFHYPVQRPDGTWGEVDRSDELVAGLKRHGIDALITIGGDGSLSIGYELAKKGVRVVGVPKTIDNDSRSHVHDVRIRHRRVVRDRLPRSPALHRRVASSHHGRRGHGTLRGLDRTARRYRRWRRRDPDPRDPVRHREGRRPRPATREEGSAVHAGRGGRGRGAQGWLDQHRGQSGRTGRAIGRRR
jgi:hypothetical protein